MNFVHGDTQEEYADGDLAQDRREAVGNVA